MDAWFILPFKLLALIFVLPAMALTKIAQAQREIAKLKDRLRVLEDRRSDGAVTEQAGEPAVCGSAAGTDSSHGSYDATAVTEESRRINREAGSSPASTVTIGTRSF
jgi:hypothetical protein